MYDLDNKEKKMEITLSTKKDYNNKLLLFVLKKNKRIWRSFKKIIDKGYYFDKLMRKMEEPE